MRKTFAKIVDVSHTIWVKLVQSMKKKKRQRSADFVGAKFKRRTQMFVRRGYARMKLRSVVLKKMSVDIHAMDMVMSKPTLLAFKRIV